MGTAREDARGAGGHEGVHQEQAGDEATEADQAAAGATKIDGEEKEQEL